MIPWLLVRENRIASLFVRSASGAVPAQHDGTRYRARRTVTSCLGAVTRPAAAIVTVAMAAVGLHEAVTSSPDVCGQAVCNLSSAPLHPIRSPSVVVEGCCPTTVRTVGPRPSGSGLHQLRHECERDRICTNTIVMVRNTSCSCTKAHRRSNNSRRRTISDTISAAAMGTSTNSGGNSITTQTCTGSSVNGSCCHHRNVIPVRIRGQSRWEGVIPSVLGASAARPLHLRGGEEMTKEDEDSSEAETDELIGATVRSRRKRASFSSRIPGAFHGKSFKKALRRNAVTFASLGAAVFAAGVMIGAGITAIRAADQRDRAAAEAAETFVQKVATGAQSRAVESDAETYSAITRQMWNTVRILAATAITNALHTLLFALRMSPVLLLVADAGLKAGVQSWAGGATLVNVIQHALLAGGYASAVGVLGAWQLVLLPVSVYLLYAATGRGLQTKDKATSGAIFAENMPIIETRLKAEKNLKKRAALAEKLLESLAREYKHKNLLDDGLTGALSHTMLQLKRDLLKGMSPEESCERAHKKFNSMLSLKFVSTATPAGGGADSAPQ